MKKINYYIAVLICTLTSCVEEFEISTDLQADSDIESILVVEATITDEFKQQQITLTRGASFANDSIVLVESGASVTVVDDIGNRFDFDDVGAGNYSSRTPFAAQANTSYQLEITTANGDSYESEIVTTPRTASLQNVSARAFTNDLGVLGVGIFVDAASPDDTPRFLRYSYEETFKIIAPLWTPFDLEAIGIAPFVEFRLIPKVGEQRVCYASQFSNSIIQNSTETIDSNAVEDFLVRFIPIDDYIISHRYSILVNQLSQSQDAYGFYETLNEQSSSNDVFSTIQPGFIEGNIQSISDSTKKVIGFFEVASASQERIFFSYTDLFPESTDLPYAINCNFLGAPLAINPAGRSPLAEAIRSNEFVYVRENNGEVQDGGPYLTARRACGDCRVIGSNIVPDFWVE